MEYMEIKTRRKELCAVFNTAKKIDKTTAKGYKASNHLRISDVKQTGGGELIYCGKR